MRLMTTLWLSGIIACTKEFFTLSPTEKYNLLVGNHHFSLTTLLLKDLTRKQAVLTTATIGLPHRFDLHSRSRLHYITHMVLKFPLAPPMS